MPKHFQIFAQNAAFDGTEETNRNNEKKIEKIADFFSNFVME